jgi:hypothetical protein
MFFRSMGRTGRNGLLHYGTWNAVGQWNVRVECAAGLANWVHDAKAGQVLLGIRSLCMSCYCMRYLDSAL